MDQIEVAKNIMDVLKDVDYNTANDALSIANTLLFSRDRIAKQQKSEVI